MGLLNLYSHEIFRKDDFARKDFSAGTDDVGGVACGIEMSEEEFFAPRFRCDSPCQRRGKVTFDFSPFREGTLQNEEICSTGQVDNRFGVVRVSRHNDRFPIVELQAIPNALRAVSHGFGEDRDIPEGERFFSSFCDRETIRGRFDPAAINLLELVDVVLKSRASEAKEVLFTREVCIFAGEKDGNEVCDVVGVEMRIEQEVNVTIRRPNFKQSP